MSSASVYALIWAAILTVFVVLFLSTAMYLLGHSKRETINFETYRNKIKYFYVDMPQIQEVAFIGYEIVLAFFSLYILFTSSTEVRVYLDETLIIIALTILTHLVWRILSGMNKDVYHFTQNYKVAQEALETKRQAEQSIHSTKEYRKTVVGVIDSFEKQIKTVTDPTPYHLKETIGIIDDFVTSQTTRINTYEDDVIERYNRTINDYFQKNLKTHIELPNTSLDFETEYNNVRSEIFTRYHQIFNDTLYQLIDKKLYNSSSIITQGLQTLKDNEYDPTQELIELILLSIDEIEGSPRDLVDYLVSKKIVELENLISYAINKEILWVFKSNIFETQEQLATISERLVKEDAYNLSIAFISNYFSRLQTVLAFIDKLESKNKTTNLFENYKKVMDVEQTFFAESKVLENKVISLKRFFDGRRINDRTKRALQDISNLTKAYENKDQINEIYTKVQDSFNDIKSIAIQSLLMYSGIDEEQHILDLVKTSKSINDYYNRLMVNDLILSSLLLYTLFIKYNDDDLLHDEVIRILRNDERYMKLLEGINLLNGFEKREQLANQIIKEVLLKKEQKRLANIVVKVEKKRASLDNLVQS